MEIDPSKAIAYIVTNSADFAKAKAERVYIENFLRSKKSILMSEAKSSTISGAEAEAYAHPEYIQLIEGLREAVAKEEELKWKLIAAQARIEVWRTTEASNRTIDRAVK